jgi:nitroreductase
MLYTTTISHLIRQRHSCRTYLSRPIDPADLSSLKQFAKSVNVGPFGNPIRYQFAAADKNDSSELKGLGTYGFIKDPPAFVIGAIRDRPGSLEDFGYLMEMLILKAADLEIGSCWLGGTFTKSRFVRLMNLDPDEFIPAVISIGYPADHQAFMDRISRIYAGADRRMPWEELFFENFWDIPLTVENAGNYMEALNLLRLAPSASNKQPWRILHTSNLWHFYLKRTPNYPSPVFKLILGLADLQRIDLGIAMSHFELGLNASGLSGAWQSKDPQLADPEGDLEYVATWVPG